MSAAKAVAVIAGVGPGTGFAIAKRFAKAYPVVLLARNNSALDPLVSEINGAGGKAIGIPTDVSDETSVKSAFEKVQTEFPGSKLAAAIYNVGGSLSIKPFLELSPEEFLAPIQANAVGGFNFSKSALPLLLKSADLPQPQNPALIFTGATASLKGSAKFAPFASGKFALRALAQSLAREFGPQGVHVSHVIIDGVIDIPRSKGWSVGDGGPDSKISPDAIAETYWLLHSQPKSAWTQEVDIRPAAEKW